MSGSATYKIQNQKTMAFTITGSGLRDLEYGKFIPVQAGSYIALNVNVVSGILSSTAKYTAETTVPASGADGASVSAWADEYGRPVFKSTNLSLNAEDVNDVSPAILQSINITELSAVGSATGSNVGAWVNMSNYYPKTIYYNFTSGTTGSMHVELEASHDAGSTSYLITAGSLYFSGTTTTYLNLNEYHEYLRARTDFNPGGTLTLTFTGRGGQ